MISDSQPAPLAIEYVPPSALTLDTKNARKHSERQIKSIAASIRSFDFNVPILVDGTNKVVAGEGRLRAAKQLGLPKVPIIRIEHLTADQSRAFAIADNRLSDTSTWDPQLLGQTFRDLLAEDLTFDLEVTGFSAAEIDVYIEGAPNDERNATDEKADLLPNGKAIARSRLWVRELKSGTTKDVAEIARRERCTVRSVNKTLSLAFLAPGLVKAAIDGSLPRGIGYARLCDLPVEWSRQYTSLGLKPLS